MVSVHQDERVRVWIEVIHQHTLEGGIPKFLEFPLTLLARSDVLPLFRQFSEMCGLATNKGDEVLI